METVSRKPFQGITNIVRFNWHFYLLALALLAVLHIGKYLFPIAFHPFIAICGLIILLSLAVSLIVSFYVYDLSNLYKLNWLQLCIPARAKIINIHAGFDETSALLSENYPQATLVVFDFYDSAKHTEVSIKRARRVYSSFPGTKAITTRHVPLHAGSADVIFCILSVHEIRDSEERIHFFQQLNESLNDAGKIVVVEHLRDLFNLLAYNIGFLHFYSEREWWHTFQSAGLAIAQQKKITPFITAFILQKNGASS